MSFSLPAVGTLDCVIVTEGGVASPGLIDACVAKSVPLVTLEWLTQTLIRGTRQNYLSWPYRRRGGQTYRDMNLKQRFDAAKNKTIDWNDVVPLLTNEGYSRDVQQLKDKWNKLKSDYNAILEIPHTYFWFNSATSFHFKISSADAPPQSANINGHSGKTASITTVATSQAELEEEQRKRLAAEENARRQEEEAQARREEEQLQQRLAEEAEAKSKAEEAAVVRQREEAAARARNEEQERRRVAEAEEKARAEELRLEKEAEKERLKRQKSEDAKRKKEEERQRKEQERLERERFEAK
ncbi:hypothetical protein BV898_19491 [Hypsibius exemplaris]|uniref:Myb/SANT-like DNA-binding domain-containing protein n=1 Tax=Hypsibius exemplaris TaxID=2072580 RepID=A0A9X6NJ60_HYPEX|nr:hypothetical protein BV898_19491 [Hypsibius exemplaris]